MSIFIRESISQESALAFRADMEKSGAGASVGGAAIATELQARGLQLHGAQILRELGYEIEVGVLLQTPSPSEGFTPHDLPYEVELFELPTREGKPLPYNEMIDEYLNREEMKSRYRELLSKHEKIIDISHFYVEAAVRGALVEELAQEEGFENIHERVIQVTHFHSSPDLMIRADNPKYHESHRASWERRMYEIAALHSSIVQFSTEQEREIAARAYDGVHGLTYEHIINNSIVAGLPLNSEAFEADDSEEKRKKARELFDVPDNALVFGMVTRIDTEKGYDLFIENFIRFLQDQLENGATIDQLPYAVVVGGIPEKDPKLKARAEEIKTLIEELPEDIKSHIRFTGEAQPAAEILPGVDAIFGPSATETFHYVPKEAGLCKIPNRVNGYDHTHAIPVFLSDIAAHRETHPGDSAFFFNPNKYENTAREKNGKKEVVYGFKHAFLVAMSDISRGLYGLKNAENSQRFTLKESTKTLLSELLRVRKDLIPQHSYVLSNQ